MNVVVTEQVSKIIVINKGLKGDKGDNGTGSGDMLSANNLSDVANVDTARNNIKAISNNESIINSLIFG